MPRQATLPREPRGRVNKRTAFPCSRCGQSSTAPIDTERSVATLCPSCFGKRPDERENQLNDLTGSEWATLSKSVAQYDGVRSEKQRLHGAAFPHSLVAAHIKTYTKRGQLVLDPFVGVGTTSEVAAALGRRSVGFELNAEFADLAIAGLPKKGHRIVCDDARKLDCYLKPESVDFAITSPPYGTLLKNTKGQFAYKWREHSTLQVISNPKPYSTHEADLGNMSYGDYLAACHDIFLKTFAVLRHSSYACWVVKDYRDLKAGVPYVNLHGDIADCAQRAGFTLWDIRIYDQTRYRPLVVLGYPSRNYYLNIGHSYIIVLRKQ